MRGMQQGAARLFSVSAEVLERPSLVPTSGDCSQGAALHDVMRAHAVVRSVQINHPLDCPICDQGGECDLQDQVRVV